MVTKKKTNQSSLAQQSAPKQSIAQQTVVAQSWSGPLPPPAVAEFQQCGPWLCSNHYLISTLAQKSHNMALALLKINNLRRNFLLDLVVSEARC